MRSADIADRFRYLGYDVVITTHPQLGYYWYATLGSLATTFDSGASADIGAARAAARAACQAELNS